MHDGPVDVREDLPPPVDGAGVRRTSIAYLGLGLVALAGAGYNVGSLIVGDRPDRLVVVGPSVVEVEHPDRARPLETTFRLRNPTSQPIRIVDVRTGCSCTTTDLSGRLVPPGQDVTLDVRINSFDTYRDTFAEQATVITKSGELDLWVAGHIPPRRDTLAFPPALHIEPDATGRWPERTIRLRVPASCSSEADAIEILPVGLGPTAAEVVEEPPSGTYREFLIRLDTRAEDASPAASGGSLHIRAGCSTAEIPIHFSSSPPDEKNL